MAWTIIGVFAAVELAFMKWLPGPTYMGPETTNGYVPIYKANGRLAYGLTLVLFFLGGFVFKWFRPGIVYDNFGDILGALNMTAVGLCIVLYLKGRFWPSGPDSGTRGNPILDYFAGIDLYPRILGWDVKHFANSRFSMIAWALIPLCFASWQAEHYGHLSTSMLVSVALQLLYLTQFFYWETGYFRTMDIQHDRAGFYLIWGVLVWVPAVYTSPTMYLAEHPVELGWPLAIGIFLVGAFFITTKNVANRERARVRRTDGHTTVWGKPPLIIRAEYENEDGTTRQSILLASGFWGVSRHFHYVGEVVGAFCWSVVGGFSHFAPFFYVTFLSILLFHRGLRHEAKCQKKYGVYWDQYKALVPWKVIPGIY
ncbi:MAG TPA: hypothetical protein VLS88_00100 [Polyangiales bacterium]|nr:hypothetical protein [Polyangiales bacterium]